jgi:hypothetical protein
VLVLAEVKWLSNPYGGFSEYCNETYTANFPVAVIRLSETLQIPKKHTNEPKN